MTGEQALVLLKLKNSIENIQLEIARMKCCASSNNKLFDDVEIACIQDMLGSCIPTLQGFNKFLKIITGLND